MKAIAYDTGTIQAGEPTQYNFFEPDAVGCPPEIQEFKERELVRWLFQNSPAANSLREELNILVGCSVGYEVGPPLIKQGTKPGDIDLLAAFTPDEALACQFKRLFFRARDIQKDSPQRNIHKLLIDLKTQVKLQIERYRFNRNLLGILMVGDTRERNHRNVITRGITTAHFSDVWWSIAGDPSIPSEAGILFVEIFQPSSKSFTQMATIGWRLLKKPVALRQPSDSTSRVHQWMSSLA